MDIVALFAAILAFASCIYFFIVLINDKDRLLDPLYIILMVLSLVSVIYTKFYEDRATFQGALFVFFLLNMFLLKIGDPDYDIKKGIDNTLRINGRCPNCSKKISMSAKKCPYCTSDL
jgi:hypothetical protein